MMTNKVSIIIPVYNSEKYLSETIDSCINQTYNDIEIISVVRPGTDNSMDILNKYSEKIRIIEKPNIKQFEAFNLGIQVMQGEWFKFMSSDDVLYPNAVEDLIQETKKFTDNNKIIYYSSFDIIDSNGEITRDIVYRDDSQQTNFEQNIRLLDGFFGNPNTSLIHRDALKKYGSFDETVKIVGDYELWLRLCILHDFRLHLIPKKLVKYRMHEDSITSNYLNLKHDEMARKIVLSKLDKKQRKLYKTALKKYQHIPLETRVRGKVNKYIFNKLPNSISKKFSNTYRDYRKIQRVQD